MRQPTRVRATDRPMAICVLFDTIDSPTGGGNQFLKALIAELTRIGHRVTTRPSTDTEIVLLNGFNYASDRHLRFRQVAQIRQTGRTTLGGSVLPLRYFLSLARRGPVIAHRVDGVPALTRGRRTKADDVQLAVNRLADHTIFQSHFCRTSFVEQSGRTPERWRVINNGVDPRIFFPASNRPKLDGMLRLVAASWSSNRRKGFSTLAELSQIPRVQVVFAGNWCPEVEPAKVELAGSLRSEELAELMRSSHAMVHAGWNEPCSNAIVEAMACGLPVIYRDSGGNAELVGDYGVPLTESLGEVVSRLIENYPILLDSVHADRGKFLIGRAAVEYASTFRHAIDSRH